MRDTAAMVGHSPGTVTKYWGEYLAESAADDRGDLDLLREELAQRLEAVAHEAHTVYTELAAAGDHRTALAYKREERSALAAVADLYGLRRVATTSTSSPWGGGVGDRQDLRKRIMNDCQRYNAGNPDTRLEVYERPVGYDARKELAARITAIMEADNARREAEGDAA